MPARRGTAKVTLQPVQGSSRTHLVSDAVLAPLPTGRGFAAAARVRLRVLPVNGGRGSTADSKPALPKTQSRSSFQNVHKSHTSEEKKKKKSTFKKPVSNNRANQCIAQMLEGFIMFYHFIFVVALQTHLSALMIAIYINLLSIPDQEQLVTMLQLKKKKQQIKTSRKKIMSFYLHRCLHEKVTILLHRCIKLNTVSKM